MCGIGTRRDGRLQPEGVEIEALDHYRRSNFQLRLCVCVFFSGLSWLPFIPFNLRGHGLKYGNDFLTV
jgi:hypothetical protein